MYQVGRIPFENFQRPDGTQTWSTDNAFWLEQHLRNKQAWMNIHKQPNALTPSDMIPYFARHERQTGFPDNVNLWSLIFQGQEFLRDKSGFATDYNFLDYRTAGNSSPTGPPNKFHPYPRRRVERWQRFL
ncbi:MAG: hypothetical protein GY900_12520 [Actinomycetia bacterium]|nr:hypothetical protein [Actinomycetes bacterium]